MHLSLLTFGCLVGSAFSSPIAGYSVYEKRSSLPHGWSKREQLDRREVMPMRIARAQRNIERGYDLLNEVSHPKSAKYGQHWYIKEVAETFAPG